jgi:hypothetical protein
LEEIMNKQSIAISVAALALGTALACVPASAQSYGKNANDGGLVSPQGGDYYAPQKPSKQQPAAAHYGRNANDGGMVEADPGQKQLYNSAPDQKSAPPHYGRNANDGGL